MDYSTLRSAAQRGLAVICALLLPVAVMAQATPPPTTLTQKETEEIVVTGTRIARPEETAMSPLATIGEQQIELSDTTNVENFLRYEPQFAQAIGSNTNNGNDGSATVDLRGLGEERTLVLVNGKRFVPYDYQGYVDLSMIPSSLIERVEIITGGASAVYGADAVAGVVNFILKDKFEGLEVDGSYGITEEGDGDTYDFSVTAGGNFADNRGNMVINLGYTKQDPIFQDARDFGVFAVASDDLSATSGSATRPGATAFYSGFVGDPGAGCVQFLPNGDPDTNFACASDFNFNPYNLYQVPQKKWTATALGSYEITDNAEFFVRGSFANNRVDTAIAPTGTFFFPFQLNVADVANGGNPYLTDATRAFFQNMDNNECALPVTDANGVVIACNQLAPGAGDGMVDIALGRRLVELGSRISEYENTAYQFVGGLRGDFWDNQHWEVFGQYGRTSRSQNFLNDNNVNRVQQSLLAVDDGAGSIVCSDTSGGCIPGNYFGEGNLGVTPEQAGVTDFVRLNLNEINKTSQMIFGGSLSGETPLQIPTAENKVAYAAGVEYREEKGKNQPDDNYIQGNAPGFGSSSAVNAKIEIQEVFAELLVPLVSDIAFAKAINFETGIRYGRYENNVSGSEGNTFYNTSYKFGADWSPVEQLRFSAMYQRAVRAPTLREIGLPVTPSTGDLTNDPCDNNNPPTDPNLIALCEATGVPTGLVGTFTSIIAGQINNYVGGNPDLKPEEADTWTAGVQWTPTFLEGLYMEVNYYDIDISDAIFERVEQDIVDGCYDNPLNPDLQLCSLISRNPLNGALIGGTETGVFRELANIATESTSGVDFKVNYTFEIGTAGTLDVGVAGAYVIDHKIKPSDNAAEYDCTGVVGNTCLRPGPEWAWIQTTRWTVGPATIQLLWRYIDSIEQDSIVLDGADPAGFQVPVIASQSYFDLSGTYDLNETWTFRAGISNLLDREPPIVGQDYGGTAENSGNTYPATYDTLGRAYYFGASAKF